jgi:RimJ/RimL family protein N-acetyltransferase
MNIAVWRVHDLHLLSEKHVNGIRQLLNLYQSVLADDFTNLENLLENTLACIPYLWLLVDESQTIYAIGSLTDIMPQRYALVHGLCEPYVRKNPALQSAYQDIFHCAFEELRLHKLKAEFDADNRGALGFCRYWGFRREACLKEETHRTGQKQDVLIYSLFAERYRNHLRTTYLGRRDYVSGT